MAQRGRNYMDRLLGRNEGRESRDLTDGRGYGDEETFFDDSFNDSASEWNRGSDFRNSESRNDDRGWDGRDREYQGRNHRTQASRTRPRPTQYKSDYERDYSTRRNPPQSDNYRNSNPNGTARGFEYNLRENESFESGRGNSSFSPGDFRNAENTRGGFFGKGPKGYKRSDERIREEVSESLYRDYHVDASEIEVDVKDGVVTLSGTVDNRQSKRAAEECIENLTGVTDVHNRIRVAEKGNVSNLRNGNDSGEKRALS